MRRPCPLLLLALLLAAPPAQPQTSANLEPFYLSLLREGQQSLARGDAAGAARDLRLACFGLLDEPKTLAKCLVHLAVAQARSGDRPGFAATFGRLGEVEERFRGYSESAVTPELRGEFEAQALAQIPAATLSAMPGFRELADRRAAAELARLPERERQKELERRLASDPDNPRWRIESARLEVAAGRGARALELLSGLADAAQQGEAGCLRGLAEAQSGRCEAAAAAWSACEWPSERLELARARLRCFVAASDWEAGDALLAALPSGVARDPEIARLARAVEKGQAEAAKRPRATAADAARPTATPTASAAVEAPPIAPPTATPEPPVPAERLGLDAAEQAQLGDARRLLAGARRIADLESALALAQPIADSHPGQAEAQLLVGEIAYRASRWAMAASYLERAPAASRPPQSQFYLAVALFELGRRDEAAAVLRPVLDRIERTPYAEGYIRRILAPAVEADRP